MQRTTRSGVDLLTDVDMRNRRTQAYQTRTAGKGGHRRRSALTVTGLGIDQDIARLDLRIVDPRTGPTAQRAVANPATETDPADTDPAHQVAGGHPGDRIHRQVLHADLAAADQRLGQIGAAIQVAHLPA